MHPPSDVLTFLQHSVCFYSVSLLGFIKYALQYGYRVMPCYCFGEELTYWQLNGGRWFNRIMLWLNKYGVPGTIFIGNFMFFPNNNLEMVVVVGKSIELPTIESPTSEDVSKYHALYMERLTELFDKYKDKYNVNTYFKDKKLQLELL